MPSLIIAGTIDQFAGDWMALDVIVGAKSFDQVVGSVNATPTTETIANLKNNPVVEMNAEIAPCKPLRPCKRNGMVWIFGIEHRDRIGRIKEEIRCHTA